MGRASTSERLHGPQGAPHRAQACRRARGARRSAGSGDERRAGRPSPSCCRSRTGRAICRKGSTRVLAPAHRRQTVEVLVVDSGSSDGSVGDRPASGRPRARDRALGVRSRQHAQPAAARGPRRRDRVPDAGRDARIESVAGRAGCAARRARSASAYRSVLTCRGRTPARWWPASWSSSSAPSARTATRCGSTGRSRARNVRRAASSRTSTRRAAECWDEVRFRDVEYAEDQAFARDALVGRMEVRPTCRRQAVMHAHDLAS